MRRRSRYPRAWRPELFLFVALVVLFTSWLLSTVPQEVWAALDGLP